MTRSPMVSAFYRVAFALSFPALLMGCPKKAAPVEQKVDVAPVASPPEVAELVPLVEDAGMPDAPDAGTKKVATGGGSFNANQARIKQCCAAMRTQAKQLGASPEANQLLAFGMQCDAMAAQVGPQGTAPEFSQIRAILKSLKLPAACQF